MNMVDWKEYDKIFMECEDLAKEKNWLYGDESLKLFHGNAIFLRIMDKTARLRNIFEERFLESEWEYKTETVEDTLKDLINYSIYLLMIERKKL